MDVNKSIFLDCKTLKKIIKIYVKRNSYLKCESDSDDTITFSMKKNIDKKIFEYGYQDVKNALSLKTEIEKNFSLIKNVDVENIDDWIIFTVMLKESEYSFTWKTHERRFISSKFQAIETNVTDLKDILKLFNKFANKEYTDREIIEKLTRMKPYEEWLVTTPDDYTNIDGKYHTIVKYFNENKL